MHRYSASGEFYFNVSLINLLSPSKKTKENQVK